MDTTGLPQTETTPEVTVETDVRPLIKSFLERMTGERWCLLKFSSPNDATKNMLANLLLDIITSGSKALLAALQSTSGPEALKRLLFELTDKVHLNFVEVLDITEIGLFVSSQHLVDLIVQEVAENVTSDLSTSARNADPAPHQTFTPAHTLNAMVEQACQMFRKFTPLILCKPRPTSEEELEDQSADMDDGCPPVRTMTAETPVEETAAVQDATEPAGSNKTSVRIIIGMLFSRAFNKAKLYSSPEEQEDIIKRLFEKTWAEVEGETLYISPTAFKNLEESIFRSLSKKCGGKDMVLLSMTSGDATTEHLIVSCVKHHLTKPPKTPSAIRRFLTYVGKSIPRRFTKRSRVGVI